ncbi:phage gp29-like protein [Rhodopseudomonas rhenobacensis]|uniref:Phage gp29-like protein n=1 Tax=Rhodopseudomonas rhenobacensis TaxID=87461 RepID=A0A7W7Z344_9BRAD|nr:phage gp29-like protein [Rhodopseudomonas rhenobacensis]
MVSRILGPDGNPVDTTLLSREVATPTVIGVRAVHLEGVASGLTPEHLAYLLRQAAQGNARDYLTLAEEMEERYLHYASQVQTRRLAIEGVKPSVAVPKGVPAKIVDFVHELIDDSGLRDTLGELTDGIAKGYAVSEPVWEYERRALRPVAYKWRDQRFFQFDRLKQTQLRLAVDGSLDGEEITKPTFIVHKPRSKAGIPIRRGFARAAAWAFLLQSFALKDWSAFAEVFGIPLRLGKYHPGASEADKKALLQAVRSIASDAAAIIPQGMELDFVETKGQRGEAVFGQLLDYLDKQVSKLVVGQTMTSDNGASMAQAKVHNEVRLDIQRADGVQLSNTLNRDLVRWAVALNFGPQDDYPRVELPVAEPEDTKALADGVAKLVPLGFRVSQAEMRSKFGLSEPGENDEVLSAPAGTTAANDDPKKAARLSAADCHCPACGGSQRASLAATAVAERDDLDDLVDDAMNGWEELVDPMLRPLRDAVARANSFAELEAMLPQLAAEIDGSKLAEVLARLTAKARGLGDVAD